MVSIHYYFSVKWTYHHYYRSFFRSPENWLDAAAMQRKIGCTTRARVK